ncbi:hypothetical protein DM02DRAFT_657657 [Periconia macrospinosa]|uniref:Uncharacterized protein n=1 Tax=Periconia macrospinosa TaxID=97972 RepID=A0A2V1DJI8_9PLEO|nr:hypothetical protein DM02DRAFT_657657 [Periconia macrospinosa]
MSATTTTISPFFSFGPDDSFISKNYEGLRYRHLPPGLHDLISSGSVLDVYWASLGPIQESWILSFKDSSGKYNLAYGPQIPPRLLTHLKKVPPHPQIRTFLGPSQSYVFWDPTSIRWASLPPSLEDSLQSWLTPSGWKAGPPRFVSWGVSDAFFAMSEYGNVAYRLGGRSKKKGNFPDEKDDDDDDDGNGDDKEEGKWEIWRETVEEWRGERGFVWSEVAFISLDPTTRDQFIAMRNDGTWAGSIDDVNEEALSGFAVNFFKLTTRRRRGTSKAQQPSSSSQQQQQQNQHDHHQRNYQYTNGSGGGDARNHRHNHHHTSPPPPAPDINAPPDPQTQALYQRWATDTATLFAGALAANNNPPTTSSKKNPRKLEIRSQSSTSSTSSTPPPPPPSIPTTTTTPPRLLTTFPYLPPSITTCVLPSCIPHKSDPRGLRACKHDVERLLRASGLYSYEWLRQERIRWHPDRFGRLCEVGFREEGRRVAEEMFKVVDALVGEVQAGRRV